MFGRTNLDTYYEILFDDLPSNSLASILLGKNQQLCLVKVRSYHLLNYSHSLRLRSINYQPQPYLLSPNTRNLRSSQGWSIFREQQPKGSLRRDSNDKNIRARSTTAPTSANHVKSTFVGIDQPQSMVDDPAQSHSTSTKRSLVSFISAENPSSLALSTGNFSDPKATFAPTNVIALTDDLVTSFPSNPTSNSLLSRAIQDFEQFQNPLQQPFEAIPFMSSPTYDLQMTANQAFIPLSSEYSQDSSA